MNTTDGQCICPESYQLISGTCVCPALTTLYVDYCYDCNIQFCNLCQNNGVCSNCTEPFVPSSTGASCVCLPGFMQQGNTCVCPASQVQSG